MNPFVTSFDAIAAQLHTPIRRSLAVLSAALFCIALYLMEKPGIAAAVVAFAMIALALLPAHLWVRARLRGIPVVPLLALGEIVWFAIPILTEHDALSDFTEEAILRGAFLELYFLAFLTATWWFIVRRPLSPPAKPLILLGGRIEPKSLDWIWVSMLAFSAAFAVGQTSGQMAALIERLSFGAFSAIRAASNTLGTLAAFFLFINLRRGNSSPLVPAIAILFIATACAANAASLLLSSVTVMLGACFAGYILGSGRVPWLAIAVVLLVLQVLHSGKAEMRDRYWGQTRYFTAELTPFDYPSYYSEWFAIGVRRITRYEKDEAPSLLARTGLLHMVLFAQDRVPRDTPYLAGETILLAPKLLVPRILWPDKPRSQEGQAILSVRLGRQDVDHAQHTYIAWGQLAEFYANFGTFGAAILGVFLGGMLGWVQRFSAGVPIASYRSLVAVVFLLGSINATQIAFSTYITALFQSQLIVVGLALLTMKPAPNPAAEDA